MTNTVRVLIVLAFFVLSAGSASKSSSSGAASTTGGEYTAPPQEAAALPGSHVAGLGQPLVLVRNTWGLPLTVSVTDASGQWQSFAVDAGMSYEMRLAAGTFSYSVTDGSQSVSGTYYVEQDTSYDWLFAAE